jgi:hypothetical protein
MKMENAPFSIFLILKKLNVAFIGESSQQHVKNQPAATDHCSCFAEQGVESAYWP